MPGPDDLAGFGDILAMLDERRPFTFAKINHGFWERLVTLDRLRAEGVSDPIELDRRSGDTPCLIETGFLDELLALIALIPTLPGVFLFGAGAYAWPDSDRTARIPFLGVEATEEAIRRSVPPAAINADALLWKRVLIAGRLPEVVARLRARKVVLIGPHWLGSFGAFAGIPDFTLHQIDDQDARRFRDATFDALRAEHEPREEPVYLISAGAFSVWLAVKMHQMLPAATILDMGGILDVSSSTELGRRLWPLFMRKETVAAIEAINPAWPPDEDGPERAAWRALKVAADDGVARAAGVALREDIDPDLDRPDLDGTQVDFVEPKRSDPTRIHEIAALPGRAGGGAVARALEAAVAAAIGLPENRSVVAASSAAAALSALADARALKAGRSLRWVVSAFGASPAGVLADALVVDCDDKGRLDLRAVRRLGDSEWDGMVVADPFGLADGLSRHVRFCRERGKALIVDSSASLFGLMQKGLGDTDAVVSFHESEPWGFGEGGCAIVAAEDADLVRRVLEPVAMTGEALPRWLAYPRAGRSRNAIDRLLRRPPPRRVARGVLSDVAAAPILDRLERHPRWAPVQRRQWRRLGALAEAAGLSVLAGAVPAPLVAALPVLAARPISLDRLPAVRFATHRPPRPLSEGAPVARSLHDRIVCIPCHPGMAAIGTDELRRYLAALAEPES